MEEADEAVGWLELSHREGILRGEAVLRALDEGRQLTRILAKSRETAQANDYRAIVDRIEQGVGSTWLVEPNRR